MERPRRIILMVKAGKPVDDFIALQRPHLQEGDIRIDAGNSFLLDTLRRAADRRAQAVADPATLGCPLHVATPLPFDTRGRRRTSIRSAASGRRRK